MKCWQYFKVLHKLRPNIERLIPHSHASKPSKSSPPHALLQIQTTTFKLFPPFPIDKAATEKLDYYEIN